MEGPGLLGGRYELRDVLGFGGMAEVRDGWDTRLSRAVAIKLLHPGLSSQSEIRERFKIEARAAAALNHPNIVRVYDFGDQDGSPFIVMERLPGDTLGDRIALGPLSQTEVYESLRSVLAALAAAHDAGMLHRDIKPGNILLAPSGGLKVADFGIVKAPGSVHTTTGQLVGTLAYLSPDRIEGNRASVSDDLYAAGVVGYEAVTGRKPFAQEDIVPLAHAILQEDPPPVASLRPDIDPELAEVIERAMSRDPLRRFSCAEAMCAALSGGAMFAGQRAHAMLTPFPANAQRRTPTRALAAQHDAAQHDAAQRDSTTSAAIAPPAPRQPPVRARKVAGSAALLCAMAVAAVAFALDPTSATRPPAPEPVSVSTPVPVPISVEAAPPPVVQSPPTAPSPVVEQATQYEPRGNGKGNNGNGKGRNGNGHGKPN
jgi:serine/threonine-protein kinase